MARRFAEIVLAMAFVGLHRSNASPQILAHSSYLFDSEPAGANAVADFDNDGRMDYLLIGEGVQGMPGTGRLEVHLGNGAGGFERLPSSFVPNDVSKVAVADFDVDGNLDLVADFWPLQGFWLYLGDGLGSFDGGSQHAADAWLTLLGAGDVDGDASPDVVVRVDAGMSDSLHVYCGVPPGGFVLGQRLVGGNNPDGMTLADWNEDGVMDLAVPQVSKAALVYLGMGDGTLAAPMSVTTQYYYGWSVTAPDLDRDGHLDLVVAAADWHHDRSGISILFGTGNGSFGRPVFLDEDAYHVAVGDLDHDGLDDLVYMREHSDIGIRRQHAPRVFSPEYRVACGVEGTRAFLLDVEGDGDLDVLGSAYSEPLSAVVPGNGDGTFGNVSVIDGGLTPTSLVAADLDADGRMDVATSSYTKISILPGNGSFGFLSREEITVPAIIRNLRAADLDLDGDLDLVAHKSDGIISVANAGHAGYSYATAHPVSPTIQDLAVGNLDDDSYPDVATAVQSSPPGLPALYFASGSGTMSFLFGGWLPFAADEEPQAVRLHDLDRDGRDDLVIGFSDEIRVHRRSSAYAFASPQNYSLPPWYRGMVIDDMNGDGYPEIIASGATTVILRGNGDTSFDLAASIPIPAEYLATGDFDLDGDVDLVMAQYHSSSLVVLLQDASGGFGPPLRYGTGGTRLTCVFSADLDADAKPDIVCGHIDDPFLTLLSNLSGVPVDVAELRGRSGSGVHVRSARELADGSVQVRFEMESPAAQMRLAVYDVRGRLVQTLVNRAQPAGMHQLDWDRRGAATSRVARGVYFVELRADAARTARRVVLVRP